MAPLTPCLALLTSLWVSAVAAEVLLNVMIGDDVTLQCRSPGDAAVTKLVWKRQSQPLPDGYVFFFRDNRSNENYQDPRFRGRVALKDPEMKNGTVSVVLKNVNVNDSGKYTCQVSTESSGRQKRDTSIRNSIRLTVTESGHKAGLTGDEGTSDGRYTDVASDAGGGNDHKHVGLMLSLTGLVVCVICTGLLFRHKRRKKTNSEPAAAETGRLSAIDPHEQQIF